MWQDEYISLRDGSYICWDHKGEFIASTFSLSEARIRLTEYVSKRFKDKSMQHLYNNLLALSNSDNTPFYHTDQVKDDSIYRIFSYHFTDKDSWTMPDALESRGVMFEINRLGEMLRIASRPMQKFFNYSECINKSNEELLWSAKNAFANGQLSEDLYLQLVNDPSCIPTRAD